jgi:hypothetical protein
MSHGRLQWFDLGTKEIVQLTSKSNERYSGGFVTEARTLVVLTTPAPKQESVFVEIDIDTQAELHRTTVEGCFNGQDAVRYGVMVYVACAGTGAINVYSAHSLSLERALQV